MSKSTSASSISTSSGLDSKAIVCMLLLAVQFGIQPILTRKFTPPGITRSTVILVQEGIKFLMAFTMLRLSGSFESATKNWNISTWLSIALFPAGLYAIQNFAALTAYQNLDALTFNVLNQTKTLSAALCCYLVMGKKQSQVQVFALLLLLLAALTMEGIVDLEGLRSGKLIVSSNTEWEARHFSHGVLPILLASFLSGLAGALSQKNLQSSAGEGRNPYLFSMELCAASTIVLLLSILVTDDGQRIREDGFWKGWTPSTLIPILSNSSGGIIVGLVTKYAGSVQKGFALILGIFLSGVIQAILMPDQSIRQEQIVGGALATLSLYLHATNPPKKKVKVA